MDKAISGPLAKQILDTPVEWEFGDGRTLRNVLSELPQSAYELEQSYIEAFGEQWRKNPDNKTVQEDVRTLYLYRQAAEILFALEELERANALTKTQHDALHDLLPLLRYQENMHQTIAEAEHALAENPDVSEDFRDKGKKLGEYVPEEIEQEASDAMRSSRQSSSEMHASLAASYRDAMTRSFKFLKALNKPTRQADPDKVKDWAREILDTRCFSEEAGADVATQSFENILKEKFPRDAKDFSEALGDDRGFNHERELEILSRGPRYAAILEHLASGEEPTPAMVGGMKQLQKYIRQQFQQKHYDLEGYDLGTQRLAEMDLQDSKLADSNAYELEKHQHEVSDLRNLDAMLLNLIQEMGSVNRGRSR